MIDAASPDLALRGQTDVIIDDVTFGFSRSTDQLLLDGISLRFDAGDLVAIVGRSGVGKTTLLRLLAGIGQPLSGSISASFPVAYIPQDLGLFARKTVFQNVEIADQIASKVVLRGRDAFLPTRVRTTYQSQSILRSITALTELEIAHLCDSYPHEISGGQQQRVVLARAIAMRASLLLCDEPFSALDDRLRAESRLLLRRVAQDHSATTLLVTHNLNDAIDFADRVIVLSGKPASVTLDVGIEQIDRVAAQRRSTMVETLRGAM